MEEWYGRGADVSCRKGVQRQAVEELCKGCRCKLCRGLYRRAVEEEYRGADVSCGKGVQR